MCQRWGLGSEGWGQAWSFKEGQAWAMACRESQGSGELVDSKGVGRELEEEVLSLHP